MAKAHLTTTTLFLLFCFISVGNLELANAEKTWCVAKPSSSNDTLQKIIDYVCANVNVDCRILDKGCPCSLPDTLMNRASVAMNLYYQANGGQVHNCYFSDSGLIVITDPSYGSCIY